MQETIAVIFDFDDTLGVDSTSGYLQKAGITDISKFWKEEVATLTSQDWDPVPAYISNQVEKWGNAYQYVADGRVTNLHSANFSEKSDLSNFLIMAVRNIPDWTIEILSPDQSQTKVIRNILHCLAHGTQMDWLIDTDEKLVSVYFADQRIAIFESEGDHPPVPPFAASLSLTVGQMFSWLAE